MNVMELLTAPLAQATGWALLHLLWQATIVAGILAAALGLLSRHSANTRYAVCCAALTLVFAMFVGTAYRAYEPSSAPMQTTAADETIVPVTRVPVLIAAAATESWRERAMDTVAGARRSLPHVVAIWLAGVVFLSARLLLSWANTRRLIHRGAREASAGWQHMAQRLSDAFGLRRAVRLVESAAVEVPSVIGTLRPVILLPASALTGMASEQIEMVLAHELAHIRRHDFLVNLLQAIAETLMFYHPAVWWMSRRVRIERENCCDDLAVAVCGDPIQYARALTRLEELRVNATAITVAATGGSLLDRVRRIIAGRAEVTGISSRWAAAVTMLSLVIIALAIPSLPALADRENKGQKKDPLKAVATPEVQPAPEAPAIEAVAEAYEEAYDVEDLETPTPPPAPRAIPAPPAVAVIAPTPRPTPAPRARIAPIPPVPPVDEPSDRSRTKFGASGKLTVDELIALRNSGVTPEYVKTMRGVFPDVTLGEIVGLSHMGVTSEYVVNLRAAGVDIKTSSDARRLGRRREVHPRDVEVPRQRLRTDID